MSPAYDLAVETYDRSGPRAPASAFSGRRTRQRDEAYRSFGLDPSQFSSNPAGTPDFMPAAVMDVSTDEAEEEVGEPSTRAESVRRARRAPNVSRISSSSPRPPAPKADNSMTPQAPESSGKRSRFKAPSWATRFADSDLGQRPPFEAAVRRHEPSRAEASPRKVSFRRTRVVDPESTDSGEAEESDTDVEVVPRGKGPSPELTDDDDRGDKHNHFTAARRAPNLGRPGYQQHRKHEQSTMDSLDLHEVQDDDVPMIYDQDSPQPNAATFEDQDEDSTTDEDLYTRTRRPGCPHDHGILQATTQITPQAEPHPTVRDADEDADVTTRCINTARFLRQVAEGFDRLAEQSIGRQRFFLELMGLPTSD